MWKYASALFLYCIFGRLYATDDTLITLLKHRQDLIPEVVDLWWEGQGACQKTHNEKPVEFLLDRLMQHLHEDELPLCFIALKNDRLVGMIRLSHHWAHDLSIVPAQKISTHAEWFPWIHGGCMTVPGHEDVVNQLLDAVIEKVRQFGYKQIYLALFLNKDHAPYEQYGFEKFDNDLFRGVPIDLLCCTLDAQE